MGHCIEHLRFDVNDKKDFILNECNERAIRYGDSRSGLYDGIIYKDKICQDSDEAYAYLESIDREYSNFAVRYYDYSNCKKSSKKLDDLNARLKTARDKLTAYTSKSSVANFKSAFVGCKKCNSKINKTYAQFKCPVCGEDLRSDSTLKTIDNYKQNIKYIEKQIKEEERKIQTKLTKQAKIKWLVKIEYHC